MKLFWPCILSLPFCTSFSAISSVAQARISRPFSLRGGAYRPMALSANCLNTDPMSVIQRQLETYNRRDLEEFMTLFSEDCTLIDLPTGAVLAQGKEQIRPRYQERFSKSPVHCVVTGRLCNGRVVVDREYITGLPEGGEANVLAVYQVNEEGLINRVQFVWEPVIKA